MIAIPPETCEQHGEDPLMHAFVNQNSLKYPKMVDKSVHEREKPYNPRDEQAEAPTPCSVRRVGNASGCGVFAQTTRMRPQCAIIDAGDRRAPCFRAARDARRPGRTARILQ